MTKIKGFIRNLRGICPDTKLIIRFVDAELPAEAQDRVSEHLLVCGDCLNEVNLLRHAKDDPIESTLDDLATGQERIRERFSRYLATAVGKKERRINLPRGFAWGIAAVLIVSVYPAYLGFRQLLGGYFDKIDSVEVVQLEQAVRGLPPKGGSALVAKPTGNFLGLMFFVPIEGNPEIHYHCQIRRGTSIVYSARDVKSFDGLGNFLLTISTRGFKWDDDYLLIVTETGGSSREWRFPFAIGRQQH